MSEEEDQTSICFKDNRWFEWNPLNKDTVMDYFSLSSFYDRTCNNEQVKMQRLDPERMKEMKGIEYVLIDARDPLYIIRKQRRENEKTCQPLSTYYVLHRTIFQCPSAFATYSSRMIKSLKEIQKAFKEATEYYEFDPYQNYTWNFHKGAKKKQKLVEPTEITRDPVVDQMVASLWKQFPPPPPQPSNAQPVVESTPPSNTKRKINEVTPE